MISPSSPSTFAAPAPTPGFTPQRGGFHPVRWLLSLFSSIWLGVTLLFLLFVYSSIGSAGVPVSLNLMEGTTWVRPREEFRWLEMTEFEWFHWWPFNLLIALICTNLIVATLRRIPFKLVNLGVLMIHTGIITLCVGSVIYFGTKLEGDSPVIRRQVLIEVPGEKPAALPAIPGANVTVGNGTNRYELMISEVDPHWEIISEPNKGVKAYKVSVLVQSPTQQFTRVMLAGYPQYTEDVIRTDDPKQPMKRAKKIQGEDKPLVDEALNLQLAHCPQDYFYLQNSSAIYLREVGAKQWIQRPIKGLPRYNEYLPSREDVWLAPGEPLPPIDPLDIAVPASAAEPPGSDLLQGPIQITGYLRYAHLQSRRWPGGDRIDPMVRIQLTSTAQPDKTGELYDLAALDPAQNAIHVRVDEDNSPEIVRFRWVNVEADLAKVVELRMPKLQITVPAASVDLTVPIESFAEVDPDLPFTPIEGTEYNYRVRYVQDNLRMADDHMVSVASVELRKGERTWERWVFDVPGMSRDLETGGEGAAHGKELPTDEAITIAYRPGNAPPPVLIVAGPDPADLRVVTTTKDGQRTSPIAAGTIVPITDDVSLKLVEYAPRCKLETRPAIVPSAQRDRALLNSASMIKVEIPIGGRIEALWLPYHEFAYVNENDTLRRSLYRPSVVQLPDGRTMEIMYSRERRLLPAPVVLDDFILSEQTGGYSGEAISIRDWTSVVSFEGSSEAGGTGGDTGGGTGGWTEPIRVSMNNPAEQGGYWFYQAQWDAPTQSRGPGDPSSQGLNYTVLGVGNRNGVHVQLVGCCIAVSGMIFAFYIKPIIKRRRKLQVHGQAAATRERDDTPMVRTRSRVPTEPVRAALEES